MAEPMVFKFSTLIMAIPFGVAAVAVIAAAVFFAARNKGLGILSLVVALVSGLVFGPAMLFDRVAVTAEHIEQRTGFGWSQTVKGFRFADVSFVRITNKPTGPKRRLSAIWEIHEKNGTTRDLDPGDLWEANSEEIVALLRDHGVEFR